MTAKPEEFPARRGLGGVSPRWDREARVPALIQLDLAEGALLGCNPLTSPRVFCFGFFQDWHVRVGVLPECEEILVGAFGFGGVALHGVGATDLEMRDCSDG